MFTCIRYQKAKIPLPDLSTLYTFLCTSRLFTLCNAHYINKLKTTWHDNIVSAITTNYPSKLKEITQVYKFANIPTNPLSIQLLWLQLILQTVLVLM